MKKKSKKISAPRGGNQADMHSRGAKNVVPTVAKSDRKKNFHFGMREKVRKPPLSA